MTLLRGFVAAVCFAVPVASVAADALKAEDANAYASSYQKRIDAPAAKPAVSNVRIFRGADKDADNDRLLADGYDLLGVSTFKSSEVPPDMAVAHAKNIKADLVMVYSTRFGKIPNAAKSEAAADAADQEKVADDAPKMQLIGGMEYTYEYYATFWIKAK